MTNKDLKIRRRLKLLPLVVIGVINFGVYGDQLNEQSIERIEVTTNKRSADVDAISASISVLTAKEITARGVDNLQDALGSIAGVNLHQPLKNRSTITIRGINSDIGETQLTQDPVGLYVDDIPLTGTYAEIIMPDISLYDMQRIEVARGPQGTMYGSGNIGGAVRLITKAPELTKFAASARVDLGKTQNAGTRQRYDGMINLPIFEDKLALRAVASVRKEDGWLTNTRLNTSNDYAETQFRVALYYSVSEKLDIKLSSLNIDSNPEDADNWNPPLGQFNRSTPISDGRVYDMQLNSLKIEYFFEDFADFISSTNSKHTSAKWFADLGPFPGIGDFVNQSQIETDAFIQEFRLLSNTNSAFSWIAGLYFFDNQLEGPLALNILGLQAFVNGVIPGRLINDLFFGGAVDYSMQEKAAFADFTYAINREWEGSVGLRYFETESTYSQREQSGFDFVAFDVFPFPDYTNKVKDNGVMWRSVITYKPTQNSHYFASVSKGMRAGQTNPNFGPSPADPSDVFIPEGYASDTLYSTEVGAKFWLSNGRINTNISLFYMDWQGIQVDGLRLSDNSNYIANAGDAFSQGIELELRALIGEQSQGYLSFTWQQSEIDNINGVESFLSGAVNNDELPGAPDIMANAGISTAWQVFDSHTLTFRLDAHYVGDSVNRFTNVSGRGIANPDFANNDAYFYAQSNLTLQLSKLSLSAYIENLSNNDNIILNVGQTLTNPAVSLRPRTFGLRVNYVF